MAITKISGVPWANLAKVSGIAKASISNIGGATSPPSVNCIPFPLGYSDGRNQPPEDACTARPRFYEFDDVNELLYESGGCGVTFAVAGYYSDGAIIYFWGAFAGSWVVVQPCGR